MCVNVTSELISGGGTIKLSHTHMFHDCLISGMFSCHRDKKCIKNERVKSIMYLVCDGGVIKEEK